MSITGTFHIRATTLIAEFTTTSTSHVITPKYLIRNYLTFIIMHLENN